jgi:hypothetical protein
MHAKLEAEAAAAAALQDCGPDRPACLRFSPPEIDEHMSERERRASNERISKGAKKMGGKAEGTGIVWLAR